MVYNQNLRVDDKYIIVEFEQLSQETAVGFTWTLLNS